MEIKELIRIGRLDEAIVFAREQIKRSPADGKLRVLLFQLLLFSGQWDKAMLQLNVAAEIDPLNLLMAQTCRPLLQCEAVRSDVFTGSRLPMILGKPSEWVGWLVKANQLAACDHYDESSEFWNLAFDAAPATAGVVNDQPFEWIADADGRFGPVMEAIVDGKYYWIPFENIVEVRLEKPVDLRDVIWLGAEFTWTNSGTSVGFVPVRYPGTEKSHDEAIRLGRRTDWLDRGKTQIGLGQRMLTTDIAEYPLLEIRTLKINHLVGITSEL